MLNCFTPYQLSIFMAKISIFMAQCLVFIDDVIKPTSVRFVGWFIKTVVTYWPVVLRDFAVLIS